MSIRRFHYVMPSLKGHGINQGELSWVGLSNVKPDLLLLSRDGGDLDSNHGLDAKTLRSFQKTSHLHRDLAHCAIDQKEEKLESKTS